MGRGTGGQMPPLLRIEGLHTRIDLRRTTVRAVDGVSLEVQPGETLGLVGESGCGKTMTALSVMRLLPPGGHVTGGRIVLDGTDLTTLSDDQMRHVRGNDIGMIFQDPMTSLNPTIRIGAQIAESMLLHRDVSRKEALDRAIEVLRLVGMPHPEERAGDYPHQLSGGMRQRVMIAMALACEPKLLIADEPTTALDVTIQKQILELIDDLRRRLGMAVILVTHDLGVIAGRADRVAVMYAGRVVETTDTETLYANARHPYTEALFTGLPENAAETRRRLYSIPGLPPDLTNPPSGCRFAPRCRYATHECRDVDPTLDGDVPDHLFACIHPVGRPEVSEPSARDHVRYRLLRDGGAGEAASEVGSNDRAEPLLEVDHVVKDFPVTAGAVLQRRVGRVSAVADVTFDVPRGSTFGLVGESGCGKTTVGRLVVGLERPSAGTVRVEGQEFSRVRGRALRQLCRGVQLMFQDSYGSLDPRMRVGGILREPLVIQGIGSRREQERRVAELLDEVGLPRRAVDRYPHEFSGGQRQRVGLARALTLNPQLVVADEPVSALDVSIQAQILNLMQDLQRRHGLTYVIISHDLSVIRYLSDTIGVMYLGKLVEIGPADSVYERPRHPYTRGLIDTVPAADPWREKEKRAVGVTGELPSAIHPPSGCRFRTRCPFAEEVCAHEEPQLRALGTDGHRAACHFPLGPAA
ncbi:MAG: dipeptide ABC transporter ATP-binding protein [Streptosporangiales bacterium]|nr:dipeptide ABC transporter ATP-binding protein [Streptosporangiales bacterium]